MNEKRKGRAEKDMHSSQQKGRRKFDLTTLLLVLVLFAGIGLIAYPSVSNAVNSINASQAISTYDETVARLTEENYAEILGTAHEYNARLASSRSFLVPLTDSEMEEYVNTLDITGTGIMGSIEIPKIRVSLPIYHSVEESVLQIAAGHFPGSSLPVGANESSDSVHTLISGHRGLTSATLFTNLDKLEVGDVFLFKVLNETVTYEIDEIRVIEPDDTDGLGVHEGEDLATLITCTPYGINSHRLVLTGHRIENLPEGQIDAISDAVLITPVTLALYIVGSLAAIGAVWYYFARYRRKGQV